jgi:hypothetical protein
VNAICPIRKPPCPNERHRHAVNLFAPGINLYKLNCIQLGRTWSASPFMSFSPSSPPWISSVTYSSCPSFSCQTLSCPVVTKKLPPYPQMLLQSPRQQPFASLGESDSESSLDGDDGPLGTAAFVAAGASLFFSLLNLI